MLKAVTIQAFLECLPDSGSFEPTSFAKLVKNELAEARAKYPRPMNSAHEGYATILEEVDELWDEVRAKQGDRDPKKMVAELVQIAAMCQRMAEDVVRNGRAQD